MHLNCSQQILTAVLNGKDNKNAQHRKDLSECLHTPDAQTCTDMWFTNVEVLRVEYKIYFSSTQNVLLICFVSNAPSLLSFTISHVFNVQETNNIRTLPDQNNTTSCVDLAFFLFQHAT